MAIAEKVAKGEDLTRDEAKAYERIKSKYGGLNGEGPGGEGGNAISTIVQIGQSQYNEDIRNSLEN